MSEPLKTSPQRIAVKLKSAAERMIRKGHPWVFNESITKESTAPKSGDLAIIYDHRTNKLLAIGLFDCESPIRIKIVHFGGGAQINEEWFLEKVKQAYSLRETLLASETNSYRLLFGEADGLPGVICDVYAEITVLKIYSAAWLPYMELLCNAIKAVIKPETIVLRLSRSLKKEEFKHLVNEGDVLHGELSSEEVIFKEHGVKFQVNVIHGHKTGFFLDHRDNRKRVGEMSKGKTVLDVFSYAGGFSVHALTGGAERVLSLDISEPALELAKKNAELNEYTGFHEVFRGDAFRQLDKMVESEEKFDIVIIDPPSFAKQKTEVENAIVQYARLAKLGSELVNPEGILLLASCSSRVSSDLFFDTVEYELSDSHMEFEFLEKKYHDTDHPTLDSFTEGSYLKCGYYKRIS